LGMRLRSIVMAAVMVQSAAVGSADTPLQPAGPWHVDYEDSQCLASRDYRSTNHPLTLTLAPSITNAAMRILFVRNGHTPQTQQEVTLRLGGQEALKTFAFVYEPAANGHRIYSINVTMQQFRAAEGSQTMAVDGGDLKAELVTDMLPQVLAELDKCILDLQRRWNVTLPLRGSPGSNPNPSADVRTIFSNDDYPAIALYHGQSGEVGVSLLIDETGRVADCSVDKPSGFGILDVATCVLIRNRARFIPATDSAGKPTRDALATVVTWKISH
jgi:TonB family protein